MTYPKTFFSFQLERPIKDDKDPNSKEKLDVSKWDAKTRKATCQLYYNRAQAYLLLGRLADYWHDASISMATEDNHSQRMELLDCIIDMNREAAERLKLPQSNNAMRLKKWRDTAAFNLDKALEVSSSPIFFSLFAWWWVRARATTGCSP